MLRIGLFLTVLVVLTVAAPASAQQLGARAELIAERLREDNLYISDAIAPTPEEVAAVRAAIEQWDEPVWVVWAPELFQDPGAGFRRDALNQVRDRLGERGMYFWADDRGSTDAVASGRVRIVGEENVLGILSDDVPQWKPPSAGLIYALNYVRTGERPTRGAGDEYRTREDRAENASRVLRGTAFFTWIGLVMAFGLFRVRHYTAPISFRRSKRRRGGSSGAMADARRQLNSLTARLEKAPNPPSAAVDAHAAARVVLGWSDLGGVDLAGVRVLVKMARDALGGRTDLRPCFFNPEHGWAQTTVTFQRSGQTVQMPTCSDCSERIEQGLEAAALRDGSAPYWERDTVWARTGFGSIDRDLARDILAGQR